MKPVLLYFCSNGVGENLQASGAMRRLKLTHHVIMVCKQNPANVLHPDCYSELVTFNSNDPGPAIAKLKSILARCLGPVIWTAHLDPFEPILTELQALELVAESLPRQAPPWPCSASLAFWSKTVNFIGEHNRQTIPDPEQLRMIARAPDTQRVGDYDVMVSMGSAEKMRRLPEITAVEFCNRLNRDGYRVVLHGSMDRPAKLHSKVGCAVNRWSDGSMHQLMDLTHGVRALVSPDSGPVHLALAYGKKVLFLESREHGLAVIDEVHRPQVTVYKMHDPQCDVACSARRPDFNKWPAAGTAATKPDYPFNMACSNAANVPCLQIPPDAIDTLCQLPLFK